MRRTLLQGGDVLTLDPALGDIPNGDVLIEDDVIREVGRGVRAPDAERVDARDFIVMPGLVNAHQHTWQTGVRGIAGDWSLAEYLRNVHEGFGPRFRPEDVYLANLVGALNQLACGATTLFDWCHNNPTPDHTDAGIDGLAEAGIRAVFGHGTPKPRIAEGEPPLSRRPHPPGEIARLRKGRLASEESLITLAMAARGPDLSALDVCVQDARLAREHGLLWSAHVGGGFQRETPDGIRRLAREGLLGPDFNAVHANQLSGEELGILVDSGCSITSCPEVEMQMGHGEPVIARVLVLGGRPTLGIDVESNISGDVFTMMRMGLQFARARENQKTLDGRTSPARVAVSARRALEWATIDGARALGLGERTGSLTPGKQADVILLRKTDLNLFPAHDALETVVFQASFANVDAVFVAGEVVKKGGALRYPRLREKMEALAESGRRLLNRREASPDDGRPKPANHGG